MKLGNYLVKFTHQNNTNQKDHYVPTTAIHPVTKQSVQIDFLVLAEPSFTECRIYKQHDVEANTAAYPEENRLGHGVAVLHPGGTFSPEEGRKWSLRRAMVSAGFDKAQRTELWEQYRTSTPIPRWGKGSEVKRFRRLGLDMIKRVLQRDAEIKGCDGPSPESDPNYIEPQSQAI